MAQSLVWSGADFELHYYIRSRASGAFLQILEEGPIADRLFLHVSEEGDSLRHRSPASLRAPGGETVILACGPGGFMDQLRDVALDAGWEPDQLLFERFTAPPPDSKQGGPFEVEIASTGQRFRIDENATIAGVLRDNGVQVDLSCEQGMCGACVTPVLVGELDHRDNFLSDAEKAANDQMTICCSRALSPLVVLGI